MNTPITFKLAKVLNEKGLPGLKEFYMDKRHYDLNYNKLIIADVIMWLYGKHGIWIVVNIDKPHFSKSCMFFGNVIKFGLHHKNKHRTVFYNSPTEAYIAGITYCLENLID